VLRLAGLTTSNACGDQYNVSSAYPEHLQVAHSTLDDGGFNSLACETQLLGFSTNSPVP